MYSPNIDNGKTIGKGGFGKCKVKFSSKYNKKIVEKQICPKSCFRASLIRNFNAAFQSYKFQFF